MTELLSSVPREGHYALVVVEDRRSAIRFFAPHAGCIEPCTGPIVSELAGDDHDYFLFRGEMRRGCFGTLHVSSTRYDQPDCLRLAGGAAVAISVHGCSGDDPFITVGGGNAGLSGRLLAELGRNGFPVSAASPALAGADPRNFVNRCALGGVQLELSAGFRRMLFPSYPRETQRHPVEFRRFIDAVRGWVAGVEAELGGNTEVKT